MKCFFSAGYLRNRRMRGLQAFLGDEERLEGLFPGERVGWSQTLRITAVLVINWAVVGSSDKRCSYGIFIYKPLCRNYV